ncbi:hypothetical protein [Ramlibacter sp. WS9]|uniref:hypothetical protein n=1 Tax=Ramlibacter sp. WS9 TaxID=1882741 RepID=UPI00114275D7|nr:hypothetical protein [Ramlibacter sp. WS9]ROZ64128.1 hypothetical protein EEB15_29140 [Ramlibacter sp. WS9]
MTDKSHTQASRAPRMVPPPSFPLIISPRGRHGNLMFQYMLAAQLQRRLGPRAVVHGPGMPEWGCAATPVPKQPTSPLVLDGHLFDLDEIAHCLRAGLCNAIVLRGWGMRVEYYPEIDECRALFKSDVQGQQVGDDEVLINVRAEDIESGRHPGYFPLPFDFYASVIRAEGKRPVFMGQLQPGPYVQALRQRFPLARYLPLGTPIEDFQTMRNAGCVVPSISSFAWLATWLSESAHTIHLPVAGLFDPRRERQNLMPVGDARYRYWSVDFPPMQERPGIHAATWAAAPRNVVGRSRDWAIGIARAGLTRRVVVKPGQPVGAPRAA